MSAFSNSRNLAGARLPTRHNARRSKLTIDDLDFFLLASVSRNSNRLTIFGNDNLGQILNLRVPHFTRFELVAALLELFHRGDLEALLASSGRRRRKTFQPNWDEIEAGIAGALDVEYRLTSQGGERWAKHLAVDWSLWDSDVWWANRTGSITTASRELTEFLLEKEVRQGQLRGIPVRKEVRPWKPTYWHEEPIGYQVLFRHISFEAQSRNEAQIRNDDKGSLCQFDWDGFLPLVTAKSSLEPRRERRMEPDVRIFQSLKDKPLKNHCYNRSVLTRLAATIELARRPGSTKELIALLSSSMPDVRFAAARGLGQAKAIEAVPALISALLRFNDEAAAEALGCIGDSRALGPLFALFEGWLGLNEYCRSNFLQAVERAIVQFGDKAIVRLERIGRKSPYLKLRIFYALSNSQSPRAAQIVTEQMPFHGYPFMDFLAGMGNSGRANLLHIATDEKQPVDSRAYAAEALAEHSGNFQEEGRQIADAIRQHKSECKINDCLDPLIAKLKHPSYEERLNTLNGLIRLDARVATVNMAELSNDDRWEIRATLGRALSRWGGEQEALQRLRQDQDIIVRGCAVWGK